MTYAESYVRLFQIVAAHIYDGHEVAGHMLYKLEKDIMNGEKKQRQRQESGEASGEVVEGQRYSAKRTALHMGSPESADIVVAATPFHIEVKGGKRTPNPYEAIAQAKRDCGVSIPLVMVKKDNAPWLFVIHEDDFMEIWDNERA